MRNKNLHQDLSYGLDILSLTANRMSQAKHLRITLSLLEESSMRQVLVSTFYNPFDEKEKANFAIDTI